MKATETRTQRRSRSLAERETPTRRRPDPAIAQRHAAVAPATRRGERRALDVSDDRAVFAASELERTAPRAPLIMLILAMVVAGMVGLVLINTAINEDAFELHTLNRDKRAADLRERQLQRDVAELESAGALDAASKRLGLVDAGTPAFITVPDGQVLGVPEPAGR